MNASQSIAKTDSSYKLLSALGAFVLWGSWAYFVNREAHLNSSLLFGLVQGTASFIITLIMVRAVTALYNRISIKTLRLILPGLVTVICTGSALFCLHFIVNTPNIMKTILPALTVAFLFCLYTTYKLETNILKESENRDD